MTGRPDLFGPPWRDPPELSEAEEVALEREQERREVAELEAERRLAWLEDLAPDVEREDAEVRPRAPTDVLELWRGRRGSHGAPAEVLERGEL